ncbi:MAG: shikimate kinase [Bacteroidales bacterium]|nr:shikimate kinase [Bacteroidales bacterium]
MALRPIYLIGYMAVGKTTLGTALAEAAGVRFVDLDAEIERRAGMSVSEIFAQSGEAEFRRSEVETLAAVSADAAAAQRPTVIACGGGTPCRPESMRLMLDTGTVVWLQADTDRVISRLLDAPGQRPRIDALRDDRRALTDFVLDESRRRECHYSRAHSRFDATRLDTPAEVAETVARFIDQFLTT